MWECVIKGKLFLTLCEMDLSYTLGVIVIFECLLTAFFLLGFKGLRRLSNRLLGAFFLSIAFTVTDGLLFTTGAYLKFPQLLFWGNAFSFLLAPLLYCYTRSLVFNNFKLQWRDLVHALPFLVVTALLIVGYHLKPVQVQQMILAKRSAGGSTPAGVYLLLAVNYLQIVAYVYACFRLIKRYRLELRERFSSIRQRDLSWLAGMLRVFAGLVLVSMANAVAEFGRTRTFYHVTLIVVITVILVFMVNVLYKALRQPELFSGIEGMPQINFGARPLAVVAGVSKNNESARKYAGSSLTGTQKEEHYQRLQELMALKKPFLDPELSLNALAAMLDLSPRTLSQVINESAGMSFFDFINSYRIREAQALLAGPDKKITVLEVLYEVGFNSKSSFNTAFKKATGLTPSAFKSSVRAAD